MEYADYLKSNDWKHKRAQKVSKRYRCGICGDTNNVHVHHLNYKNLMDVKQIDLRKLCKRCHFLSHKLMKSGKIVFRNDNHHSQWAILKAAVKKKLKISNINMFESETFEENMPLFV